MLFLSLYPTALSGDLAHSCYTVHIRLIELNYEWHFDYADENS